MKKVILITISMLMVSLGFAQLNEIVYTARVSDIIETSTNTEFLADHLSVDDTVKIRINFHPDKIKQLQNTQYGEHFIDTSSAKLSFVSIEWDGYSLDFNSSFEIFENGYNQNNSKITTNRTVPFEDFNFIYSGILNITLSPNNGGIININDDIYDYNLETFHVDYTPSIQIAMYDNGGDLVSIELDNYSVDSSSLVLSSSFDNYENFEDIDVYPNPSTDVINISSTYEVNYELSSLIDLWGNEVLSIDSNRIDVSDLPSGVYYLYVNYSSDNDIKCERVIVE